MEQIEFKSDAFLSFYSLFNMGFMFGKKDQDTALNTFGNQFEWMCRVRDTLLTYPSPLPAFQGITDKKEFFPALFAHIKGMQADVYDGKISNVEQLSQALSDRFGMEKLDLSDSYQAYQDFFSQNEGIINTNLDMMRHIYNDTPIQMPNLPVDADMPKTTGAYLEAMRRFFEVSTDKNPTVCLHPFPDDPKMSGWASDLGPHQTFCTKRLESDDKYVGETTLLSRRTGTAMHEAAHWMFENGLTRKEFDKAPSTSSSSVGRFISIMERYFNKNKETNYHSPTPLGAIHEALASSAGVVMRSDSMKDFDYKTAELYWGFKAGNDLARIVYPIFHEYIASGKTMSDGFFDRVISDKNFQQHFGVYEDVQSSEKKGTLSQTLASCTVDNAKTTNAPQRDILPPQRTPVGRQNSTLTPNRASVGWQPDSLGQIALKQKSLNSH